MTAKKKVTRSDCAFKATDDQRKLVKTLVGYGIPQTELVSLVINPHTGKPISHVTLREHFRLEIDSGTVEATAKVAGALFKNATENENVSAQIFWLKTRARWKPAEEEQAPKKPTVSNEDLLVLARKIAVVLYMGQKSLPKSVVNLIEQQTPVSHNESGITPKTWD